MSNGQPELALCADETTTVTVGPIVQSAASGIALSSGTSVEDVLARVRGRLKILLVDGPRFAEGLTAMERFPESRLVVLADSLSDALIAGALREPRLAGFVGVLPDGCRPWEVSYIVRRLLSLGQPAPTSADLLMWGASSVTWRPRRTGDRDQTVRAVELVAGRFGIGRRLASAAADAAHELLMNAMYDAPVDASGRALYAADRQAAVELQEHEVPTLRLTVDPRHLALDILDPFGRLPRGKLFGGILRGRSGAAASDPSKVLDVSHGGAGLGLFNLFNSSAVLRAEVVPGESTLVSWVIDRTVNQREQRHLAHSLYFVEGASGERG